MCKNKQEHRVYFCVSSIDTISLIFQFIPTKIQNYFHPTDDKSHLIFISSNYVVKVVKENNMIIAKFRCLFGQNLLQKYLLYNSTKTPMVVYCKLYCQL